MNERDPGVGASDGGEHGNGEPWIDPESVVHEGRTVRFTTTTGYQFRVPAEGQGYFVEPVEEWLDEQRQQREQS